MTSNEEEALEFEELRLKMTQTYDHVGPGKMMSAEAIQYKKKVFAFFHEGEMTFKLGKDFDLNPFGIHEFGHLSPFKNKPPMKAWYIISPQYIDQWSVLVEKALLQIQKEVDKRA